MNRYCATSAIALVAVMMSGPAFAQQGPEGPALPNAGTAGQAGAAPSSDPASADTQPAGGQDEIVVTGIRASLQSAQAIKRNATQIVDSIVAEDIGKLPDINVAEALQRITGVQISRNLGEGSGIAIRGLTQVRTELDGRSIFTSGSRDISLEDVPSELLAAADVYKSPSANQIEGGIGGLVNLRLRKPLDFKGFELAGQVRGTYYDMADKTKPQVSGLISDRWDTGAGEFGVLVSGSYQKTAFRSDNDSVEPYNLRTDLYDLNGNGRLGDAADGVLAPGGGGFASDQGTRTRYGANAAIQWRPTPLLELYVDGLYNKFVSKDDVDLFYSFGNSASATDMPRGGAFTVYDGTNIVKTATYANVNTIAGPYIGDRTSRTWQIAGGAKYDLGTARISVDVAHTDATNDTKFLQLRTRTRAPTLFQDTSLKFPSLVISGVDVTNPASYTLESAAQYYSASDGKETAARLDADFDIDSAFLTKFRVGIRYADRKTTDGSIYVYTDLTGQPKSALPGAFGGTVDTDLFGPAGNGNVNVPVVFASPPTSLVRDFDQIRSAFGLPLGPPPLSPLSTYELSERTETGYVMSDYAFTLGSVRVSGNGGVRVIRTNTSTAGVQQQPNGSLTPISQGASYISVLPSFNIKADLTDKLVLRGAAAKGLARPSFGNLSPSLFLDYLFRTGSAGNPNLGPLKSDQFDLSAEYYLDRSSLIYVAGFLKNVQGFLANSVAPEQINGQTFQISRPQNGADGKIRGVEVGWNQFLTFLPGPLDGLGFQANYTYVYSKAPGPLAGQSVPLEGLSKNSYNLTGLYEKGPVSLRLAYNWRSAFVQTTAGPGTGSNPIYSKGGGFLDASASFDVTPKVSVFTYGANLLRTPDVTYFGDENRPRGYSLTDRRITVGVRAKL